MLLLISNLKLDGGTQPRAAIDSTVVAEYSLRMDDGADFPPPIVFHDGSNYWLADGFHRVAAALKSGLTKIECDVRQGTQSDAQWFSYGANASHGLRRSNEDKQRAIQASLLHVNSQRLSDTKLGDHLGVSPQTVNTWRKKMEASLQIGEIETRTVTRNGTTYQQNVSNIGKQRSVTGVQGNNIPAETEPPAPVYTRSEFMRALRNVVEEETPAPDGSDGQKPSERAPVVPIRHATPEEKLLENSGDQLYDCIVFLSEIEVDLNILARYMLTKLGNAMDWPSKSIAAADNMYQISRFLNGDKKTIKASR